MRKPLLLFPVICLAATLALAQAAPPASVCEIHVNKVKPGMASQYEKGRAQHMAWHKSQNDPWAWVVWEVLTGENTGDYVVGACGHDWKDFDGRDKFHAADSANADATMGPYLASETMAYYQLRPDLAAAMTPGSPPPYITVVTFFLKPEGVLDFSDGVKKVGAALTKTNTPSPPTQWYMLASGGRGPQMVLVQDRKNIAELGGMTPKTLDQIMQEAYGDQGAAMMATIRKAYAGSYSELLRFRPDLSYLPAMPAKKP